jgi:hypothetical protein
MNSYSYASDHGYHVSLSVLDLHLRALSYDKHQWAVVPVPENFPSSGDERRSFAIVGYSNPNSSNLPNALCFLLPMFALGGHGDAQQELIVSFSGQSCLSMTKGLYFEDGDAKYDCLEDWFSVWRPIKAALWPEPGELCVSTQDLVWFEAVTSRYEDMLDVLPEDIYRAEFISYLTTLSISKEMILETIGGEIGFQF